MKRFGKNSIILPLLVAFSIAVIAGCSGNSATLDLRKDLKKKTDTIEQKWFDVSYASQSASQKLDIYLPNQGQGPFPVIIYIHGGGFEAGDKAEGQVLPMLAGLDRDYAVVSMNYRLNNEAKFPAQVQDAKAAVRYLKANSADYNLNPDKIAVWGASAGGWIAAMVGTTAGISELDDLSLGNPEQSSKVTAVVDWFGPVNMGTIDEQFTQSGMGPAVYNQPDSPVSKTLGHALTEVPDLVETANPETYISVDDPPFFIQHGDKDPRVPVEQSISFADKLEAVLGSQQVTFEILPGAQHGDESFTSEVNIDKVLDFLDRNMK